MNEPETQRRVTDVGWDRWREYCWQELRRQNRDAVAFNLGVVPYTPGCKNPGRRKL